MTESSYDNNTIMVCPFYLHANCSRGDDCDFAHEMTSILPKDVMCDFYLRGMCKYGDNCWYSHGAPKQIPKPKYIEQDAQNKIKMRYCFLQKRSAPSFPEEIKNIIADMRKSYADAVKSTNPKITVSDTENLPMDWCIHYHEGECPLGNICPCIHGEFCELCRKYCLHPYNLEQRKSHIEACEKELERDMELSFAIQNSRDKTCGICLEIVMEKERPLLRRFGILEKCSHVFCLSCIREWRRRGKQVEVLEPDSIVDQRLMRACPHCRTRSDFITPSNYWFGSEEEKMELISNYKASLKNKPCKYFKRGEGRCPFGGHCFYQHALPDGTLVELPPPIRRQRQNNCAGDLFDDIIWDYLDERPAGVLQHFQQVLGDNVLGEHFLI